MFRVALIGWLAFTVVPLQAATPEPLARISLKSVYSTRHTLNDFLPDAAKGPQKTGGLALVFLGTECPVARLYSPRMKELHQKYREQGIQFLGVYSDVAVNVLSMATHAHDEDLPFPVLLDDEHRLADALKIEGTPEAIVLNARLEVLYQGAIDDQFKKHGKRAEPTENYLDDALKALVAGEKPEIAYVPSSGCPLERRMPKRAALKVTYHEDIEPIVQQRCQECVCKKTDISDDGWNR